MGPGNVALVHDWLNQAGGAEVVLGVLHDLWPGAPVYTTIHDPIQVPTPGWDVRVDWMDRLPGIHQHHQPYLPLYPVAWSARQLEGFELVISNKSGFCHGVRTGGAVHVCYCLTPTRYVWEPGTYLAHEVLPPGGRLVLRAFLPALRRWDRAAAGRVRHFVAISTVVRERITRFYGRDSTVIFPPAAVEGVPLSATAGDYDLVLARLVPYKRIDLAVSAYRQLGRRLVVVGDGRDRARLERLAGPTIEFRGRLPGAAVAELVAGCRALVWPGVEDYGLAPVEVMAAGKPVIARRAGGVLDTVVEGVTGVFFDAEEPAALAAAVARADAIAWQPGAIQAHALRFGRGPFEARLRGLVATVLAAAPGPTAVTA
jgi:glycosyltransferase involved in cell wall biosynthesis